mmetsp:Transcript_50067/g.89873  ORF Transcript_50067/g.89873 Transcript_50067/m.89873 type:complete len:210 (-) Transcript_50067:380-1009(-)
MACFMVGHELPLFLGHHSVLLLQANRDAFQSTGDVILINLCLVLSCCHDGSFIEEIGEVCARHAWSLTSNGSKIHTLRQGLVASMNFQDFSAALHIRRVNLNLPIKAARAHQGLVQDVRPIGGCNHDYTIVALEAIHLREDLVERLLPLIVASTHASTTLTANGVDLINENNAGSLLLGLLEDVAHSRCSHTNKLLNELTSRGLDEGNT